MSNKHTPEPWARGTHSADNGEPFDVIFGASGGIVVGDDELTAANARRIVACVNACRGLPTDELDQKGLVAAVGTELLRQDALVAQMLEALEMVVAWYDMEADHSIEPDFMKRVEACGKSEDMARAAIAAARGAS